jgi:hypothetical protein
VALLGELHTQKCFFFWVKCVYTAEWWFLWQIVRFCQSFMEELYRHIGPNQAPIFVCNPCLSQELGSRPLIFWTTLLSVKMLMSLWVYDFLSHSQWTDCDSPKVIASYRILLWEILELDLVRLGISLASTDDWRANMRCLKVSFLPKLLSSQWSSSKLENNPNF